MKRDSTQVRARYLALVEKGDQAALIDFVARHPEELGSLSLLPAKRARKQPPVDRRAALLEVAGLFVICLFALVFVAAHFAPSLLNRETFPTAI